MALSRLKQIILPTAFVLLALAVLYQVIVPPIVGLASNGDYSRITSKVGLRYATPPAEEGAYLQRKYALAPEDDWAHFRSSEVPLVRLALLANRIVSKDGLFDITLMGTLHAGLYLLGTGLLLRAARTLETVQQLLVGGLALIIFADVGYVAYFNSFYSEPASLIFLVLTVGAGLLLAHGDPSARGQAIRLLGFFAAAGLLVTAKPQNALLGLPLAVLCYVLGRSALPCARGWARLGAAVPALALVIVSAWYLVAGQPASFERANLFNVVFNEILRTSPAPERDLAALGLDPGLLVYAGTTAYEPGNPVLDPAFRGRFFDRMSYGDVARFYASHPGRLIDLARRAAGSAFLMRSLYLGNFEESAGLPPYAQSQAFDAWSNRKPRIFPRSLTFLVAFAFTNLAIATGVWARHSPGSTGRRFAQMHAALIVMAALQFLVVIVGEGEYEIVKHLFLFNALIDLCLAFSAVAAAGAVTRLVRHGLRQWYGHHSGFPIAGRRAGNCGPDCVESSQD